MRSRCLPSLKPPYPPEPVVHDGVDAVVSDYDMLVEVYAQLVKDGL